MRLSQQKVRRHACLLGLAAELSHKAEQVVFSMSLEIKVSTHEAERSLQWDSRRLQCEQMQKSSRQKTPAECIQTSQGGV